MSYNSYTNWYSPINLMGISQRNYFSSLRNGCRGNGFLYLHFQCGANRCHIRHGWFRRVCYLIITSFFSFSHVLFIYDLFRYYWIDQIFHDRIPSGGIWICRRTHLPRTGRNLIRTAQCVSSDFRHRVHCFRGMAADWLRWPRLQWDINVGFVHWSNCDNVHPTGTQTSESRERFQVTTWSYYRS